MFIRLLSKPRILSSGQGEFVRTRSLVSGIIPDTPMDCQEETPDSTMALLCRGCLIFEHSKNPTLIATIPILELLNPEHILAKNIGPAMKQDLTEGSPLLNNTQSTLANIDIPVLIVAGKVDMKLGIVALVNFIFKRHEVLKNIPSQLASVLGDFSSSDLANLESTFSTAIGDKDNDCLLPYYSQIGEHIPKSSKVISKNYIDYPHFYGISKDPRVYIDILEFIKSRLDSKK